MRKLLVALGATFVVLLGTGLYQAFEYRPSARGGWFGYTPLSGGQPTAIGVWRAPNRGLVDNATDLVHRVGAWVFVALVVAVVVLWIVRARGAGRSTFVVVVMLVVLTLATVAAVITGDGLRWDQLALRAVTTDTELGGVFVPDEAKYVIFGTTQVSRSEYSSRVFLHLVVFPVGLVVCSGVLWFLSVRDDRRRATDAGDAALVSDGDKIGVPADEAAPA